MDTSQSITKMWSGLQSKHSRGHGRSALMISCEAELQDLMRELDIMVRKKDAQWEDRFNMLQTDVDMKTNELRIAQDTLELRNKEISQLRYSVQSIDKDNSNKLAKYEGEVTELRKQLMNLKRCYEKLQKKHKREYSKLEANNSVSETALQDSTIEVQRLSDKLEEYKAKSRDWDSKRNNYQTQIANLESQRKTLADKCDFMKHQSSMYKTQIDNRRELLDSTEMTLRGQVTQLEGQIQRDKDTMNYQEEKIKQLQKQLHECETSLRQTRCIKDRIHSELEEVTANKGRFEDETSNLSRELKYYREAYRSTKQRGDEMERQLVELKQKLREKNSQLNKVDEINALQESEQVRKLLTDLQNVQMSNFTLQEQEKTLHGDVERITEQISRSEAEVCRLSEALRKKNEERSTDARDARQYEAEVCRLRAKVESLEDSHDSQVDGMKVQTANLTEELHQRNTAFSNVTDKLAHTEFQYKQEVMKHQKDVSDFELTKAQLEALRHENKHLKQAVVSQQETAHDVAKFENMLKKLEAEYNRAVEKLQNENKKLKQDLDEIMFKSSGTKKSRSGKKTINFNNSSQVDEDPALADEAYSYLHTRVQPQSNNNNAFTSHIGIPSAPHYSPTTWTKDDGLGHMSSPYRSPQTTSLGRPSVSPQFTSQFNNSNNNGNFGNECHDVATSPLQSLHSYSESGADLSQNNAPSILSGVENLSVNQPDNNGEIVRDAEDAVSPQNTVEAEREVFVPNSSSSSLFPDSQPSSTSHSLGNVDQQGAAPARESLSGAESWQWYNGRPSSRASISGQFLAEEQQRSNDLQRNIDILIEDFGLNNSSGAINQD